MLQGIHERTRTDQNRRSVLGEKGSCWRTRVQQLRNCPSLSAPAETLYQNPVTTHLYGGPDEAHCNDPPKTIVYGRGQSACLTALRGLRARMLLR